MSGGTEKKLSEDKLAEKLRSDASGWSAEFESARGKALQDEIIRNATSEKVQPYRLAAPVSGKGSLGDNHSGGILARRVVLAATAALLLVGGFWLFSPSDSAPEVAGGQAPDQAEPMRDDVQEVRKPSAEDLAPLVATNAALQEVFGTVATKTSMALSESLRSAVDAGRRESSQLASNFTGPDPTQIRDLALTPGRRYGHAAAWLDSQIEQLGENSLAAASRLLSRADD